MNSNTRGILANETFQSSDCSKVDEDKVGADVTTDLASGSGMAAEEDPWDSLDLPFLRGIKTCEFLRVRVLYHYMETVNQEVSGGRPCSSYFPFVTYHSQ